MFRELVESSDDLIIVTDKQYHIKYISPSVTRSFGLEPADLTDMNVFAFVEPANIDDWKRYLEETDADTLEDEIQLEIKKGHKAYYDVSVSGLKNSSSQGLIIRLHDISGKKQKEKELIKSNEQLDQVIYKTTHDLRAPIRSAIGLIAVAEQAPAEEYHRYLELIKNSLHKLEGFIEEMNDFFRNEKLAIQREHIDLRTILNEEVNNLKGLYAEENLDVKLEVKAGSEFFSDSIRIRTIAGNILSNAIKYSDPRKPQRFIHISVSTNDQVCEIKFVDNGIGIDEAYQHKIFDLFFRGTTQSHGTGLGLFIVKDTIDRLKGTITVKSKAGIGSEFTIQIPNLIYQPLAVA